jgi:phosphoribosylformimino-5-aminoimidazole carboxamide ribotide isomerase
MRVIPVLDLKDGVVVRGIAGRRDEYRPVVSKLTPSSRPVDVAFAFRDHFGLSEIYLADLNAIAGEPPALAVYESLLSRGFTLRVDAGVRQPEDARPLAEAGVEHIVAGLETLAGPEPLEALCREYGGSRITFSLDLKEGQPLGNHAAWRSVDAGSIALRAIQYGVRSVIVLDLARVGVSSGCGTDELCSVLAAAVPEVIAGGGVRDGKDLDRLARCGVQVVLVASALHDGKLRRADLENYRPV